MVRFTGNDYIQNRLIRPKQKSKFYNKDEQRYRYSNVEEAQNDLLERSRNAIGEYQRPKTIDEIYNERSARQHDYSNSYDDLKELYRNDVRDADRYKRNKWFDKVKTTLNPNATDEEKANARADYDFAVNRKDNANKEYDKLKEHQWNITQENNKKAFQNDESLNNLLYTAYNAKTLTENATKQNQYKQQAQQPGSAQFVDVQADRTIIDQQNLYNKAMQEIKELGYDADSLLDTYTRELNAKSTEKLNSDVQKAVEEHPVLGQGIYFAAYPLQTAGIEDVAKTALQAKVNDEFIPVDINSGGFIPTNMRDTVIDTTSNAINKKVMDDTQNQLLASVASGAYGIGMSMGDSTTNMIINSASPAIGNIIIGSGAGMSAVKSATERGISADNALKTGVAAATAEILGETLSIGNFKALKVSGKAGVKNLVIDILKQSGVEGSEEFFTEIANMVSDEVINQDKSELQQFKQTAIDNGYSEEEANKKVGEEIGKRLTESFVGGAVSGGIFGAGAGAINSANLNSIGNRISQDNVTMNAVIDSASALGKESKAYKQVNEIKTKKNVPNSALGELYINTVSDYRDAFESAENQEELKAIYDKASHNGAIGNEISKMYINASQTLAENEKSTKTNENSVLKEYSDKFAKAKTPSQIESIYASAPHSGRLGNSITRMYLDAKNPTNELVETLLDKDANKKYADSFRKYADSFGNAKSVNELNKLYKNAPKDGALGNGVSKLYLKAKENLNKQDYRKIVDKYQNKFDETKDVKELEEIYKNAPHKGEIGKAIKGMYSQAVESITGVKPSIKDSTDLNIIAQVGNESVIVKNVADITKGNATVQTLSGKEIDVKDIKPRNRFQANVMNEALNSYDTNGANAFIKNAPKDAKKYNNYKVMAKVIYNLSHTHPNLDYNQAKQSIKYAINTIGDATAQQLFEAGKQDAKLNTNVQNSIAKVRQDVQRGQYKSEVTNDTIDQFYAPLAKKLGININRKLEMDENGSFVPVDLQANVSQESSKGEMYAAVHETVGEVLRAFAPEEYKNIKDTLIGYLDENLGKQETSTYINNYYQAYKNKDSSTTIEDARSEFANDLMAGLITGNENAMQKLLDWVYGTDSLEKTEKKTFLEKLKDFFTELVSKLKSYVNTNKLSIADQEIANVSIENSNKFIKMITDALDVASKNIKNAEVVDGEMFAGVDYSKYVGMKDQNGKEFFQIKAIINDTDEYKIMLRKYNVMSEAEIEKLFNTIDRATEIIRKNLEVLDYAWNSNLDDEGNFDNTRDDRAYTPIKPNSDSLYKFSLDFSTLCRKRLLQQVISERLSQMLKRAITKEEGIAIRNELSKLQQQGKQIEIACALCYVESARMKSPKQINKFLKNRGQMVREFIATQSKGEFKKKQAEAEAKARELLAEEHKKEIADGKMKSPTSVTYTKTGKAKYIALKQLPQNVAQAIRDAKRDVRQNYQATPQEQKIIDKANELDEFMYTTVDGLEWLAINQPVIFDAFTSYVRNATHAKGTEKDVWFRAGDTQKISDATIESMNNENGLRSQSWSDFQVIHLMDYVAAIIELSTRGAKLQTYTKVPDFVRLMGLTNAMINMSLIPTAEFKNKLEFDDVEGIPYNVMQELREEFPETAGNIAIGTKIAQIHMLLASADIDFVIPYHQSGMSQLTRKEMKIPKWDSFEKFQNETKTRTRNTALSQARKYGVKLISENDKNYRKSLNFSDWYDYERAKANTDKFNKEYESKKKAGTLTANEKQDKAEYGIMYGAYKAMQVEGNSYIKKCAERGLYPKYSNVKIKNETVDFTLDDNYWKVLIDRKMVNNKTGKIIDQKAVRPNFDTDTILDILNRELERNKIVNRDFKEAQDIIVDKFINGKMNDEISRIETTLRVKKMNDTLSTFNIASKVTEVTNRVAKATAMNIPSTDIASFKTYNSIDVDSYGKGYDGYSMSNNAREAYESGEMPLSKWTKTAMLDTVNKINPSLYNALSKVRTSVLKDKLLTKSSWHHTSNYYNATDFYTIDESDIQDLTVSEIESWDNSKEQVESNKFRGDINYIEWGGTRKHPKPNYETLENVNIEEKGKFYIVTDDNGNELLRKKIGSNGTSVVNYDEQKQKAKIKQEGIDNSSKAALDFYDYLKENGYEFSNSDHYYPKGRKPTSRDYAFGIENFFEKGEHRLYINPITNVHTLETFDGKKWISETDESTKYSIDVDEYNPRSLVAQNRKLQESVDYYKSQLKQKGNKPIAIKKVETLARRLKRENNSEIALDTLTNRLNELFTYIANENKPSWDTIAEMGISIGHDIINGKKLEISDENKEQLKKFQEYKFSLTNDAKKRIIEQYGNVRNWRNTIMGSITYSNDAKPLNEIWNELVEVSNGFLTENTSKADQPIRLSEAIQALRDANIDNEYGYDINETAESIMLDIYDSYFGLSDAVKKVDSKQALLNKQRLADVKAKNKAEFEQRVNEVRENYSDVYDAYREGKGKANQIKLAKQKAKFENKESRRKENIAKHKYIDRIEKNTKTLYEWLINPKEEKSVPEVVKQPVADFLESLGFYNYQKAENGEKVRKDTKRNRAWQERYQALATILTKIDKEQNGEEADSYVNLYMNISPELIATLENVADKYKYQNINVFDISANDLADLDKAVRMLKQSITTMHKLDAIDKYESITELGEATMDELSKKKGIRSDKFISRLLNFDMLSIFDYAKMVGDGGKAVVDALYKGFEKAVWNYQKVQDHMKALLEDIDIKTWSGAKADAKRFDLDNGTIHLTPAMAMDIYLFSKREQARSHMLGGGIVINTDIEKAVNSIGKRVKGFFNKDEQAKIDLFTEQYKPLRLTEKDIREIVGSLTDEQKHVADEMQKYVSSVGSNLGNEVTMKLYGFKRYTDPNYWEITSLKDFVNSNDKNFDNASLYGIKNQGFTNSIVKGANNPIVIGDAFTNFAKHMDGMIRYNAYTIPSSDAMKWINFREFGNIGVKSSLSQTYGKNATTYFLNFIKDLNRATKSQYGEELSNKLVSYSKGASVGFNLRVVIQQPTAYLKAWAVMDSKYLTKAVFSKNAAKKAEKYCPIALWKAWGFYDVDLGKNTEQIILNNQTPIEKLKEKSMALAGIADEKTWGTLWNACELEIKDKRPELKPDTEEFNQAVADRLTEVINETQVVDSVFHRSQIMRQKSLHMKMLTAFMAEPIKSYNMLRNAYMEYRENPSKDTKKKMLRVGTAFALTQVAVTMAQSIIDAFRYNDDDEELWETFIEYFKSNLADNLNPLNLIPAFKDVMALIDGWDVNRMDVNAFTSLLNAIKYLKRRAEGDTDRTVYQDVYAVAKAFSQFSGIPLANVVRTFRTVYNTFAPKNLEKVYKTSEKYQKLYEYKMAGNTKQYDKVLKELEDVDENTFNSNMSNALMKYDSRVAEAGILYLNDDIKGVMAIKDDIVGNGFNEKQVIGAIKKYANEIKKAKSHLDYGEQEEYQDSLDSLLASGYSEDEISKAITNAETEERKPDKVRQVYSTDDYITAIKNGDKKSANEIKKSIAEIDRKNGKSAEDTNSSLKSSLASEYKEKYIKGSESTRNQIGSKLTGTGFYTQDDLNKWVADSYNTDALNDALKKGYDATQKYVNERIEAKMKAGTPEKYAISGIKSTIAGEYKQAYIDGDADTRANIITYMTQTGLYGNRQETINYVNKYWLK